MVDRRKRIFKVFLVVGVACIPFLCFLLWPIRTDKTIMEADPALLPGKRSYLAETWPQPAEPLPNVIVLLADDLSRVPWLLRLSQRTVTNIRQNIVVSLLVIAFLVPAALLGYVSLLTGLIINEGAAILVILNGLRLIK